MIIWTSLTQCLIKSILKHRLVYLYLNMLDNLKFQTLLLNCFQTISAFIGVNLFKTIPWPKWQTLYWITLIPFAYQIMWYPWPNPVLSLFTLVYFNCYVLVELLVYYMSFYFIDWTECNVRCRQWVSEKRQHSSGKWLHKTPTILFYCISNVFKQNLQK